MRCGRHFKEQVFCKKNTRVQIQSSLVFLQLLFSIYFTSRMNKYKYSWRPFTQLWILCRPTTVCSPLKPSFFGSCKYTLQHKTVFNLFFCIAHYIEIAMHSRQFFSTSENRHFKIRANCGGGTKQAYLECVHETGAPRVSLICVEQL